MEDNRRRWTSVRQLEMLVEFVQNHTELALGRIRCKEGRATASRLWAECAVRLNAEGPARTGKEWAKAWIDYKCRVRAKIVTINAHQQSTGGGPSTNIKLTPLENKVANILGRDIGPLEGVRPDPFHANNAVEIEVVQEFEPTCSPIIVNSQEDNIIGEQPLQRDSIVHPVHVSPVPSFSGQTTPQRRTGNRNQRIRERGRLLEGGRVSRRSNVVPSSRNYVEESRDMVLKIEHMRAETDLNNSKAALIIAESFKLLAESVDRCSKEFCQQNK